MTVALVANIARPISSAISTAFAMDNYGKLNDYGKLGAWSPLSLFANSEVGAWYDPSDLSTMFQDRAGTTPVTADGQTVGKILDKSGRGNHATAPSDAARPLYKTDGTYHWLQFDGVDDSLSTAAIDFTGTDKLSAFWSSSTGSTDARLLFEFSPNYNNTTNAFACTDPNNSTGEVSFGYHQASSHRLVKSDASIPLNTKRVFYGSIDISEATTALSVGMRINTVSQSIFSADVASGGGNFNNQPLYIGGRGGVSYFRAGNIYSLIFRGALSTTQQITDTETWVNSKTGAY